MKNIIQKNCFLFFLILFPVLTAQGATLYPCFAELFGTVMIKEGKKPYENGHLFELLKSGSLIKTGANSSAILSLAGGIDLYLGPESTLEIPKQNAEKLAILHKGHITVTNISPNRKKLISTPDIQSRCNGRSFTKYHMKRAGNKTYVQVEKGDIHIICNGNVLGPQAGGTFFSGDSFICYADRIDYETLKISDKITNTPTARKITESSFPFFSSPIRGKKIVLDPGHGGFTGAVCPGNGYFEAVANLRVGLLLRDMLENRGAIVIMTKVDNRKRVQLEERSSLSNKIEPDLFLSIHHNASDKPDWINRTEIYIRRDADEESVKFANLCGQYLEYAMRLGEPYIAQANYHVLRETKAPAVLTEASYIQDIVEGERLAGFRRIFREAVALYGAIRDYFYEGADDIQNNNGNGNFNK